MSSSPDKRKHKDSSWISGAVWQTTVVTGVLVGGSNNPLERRSLPGCCPPGVRASLPGGRAAGYPPRGPGMAKDSDGYTDYSILDSDGYFSIRSSGRSRGGNLYADSPESWFGMFSDAAKHFLAREVALTTRLRVQASVSR